MKTTPISLVVGLCLFLVLSYFVFKVVFLHKISKDTRVQNSVSMSATSKPKVLLAKRPAVSGSEKVLSNNAQATPAVPKLSGQENEIQRIRKELQAVMDLNKKINSIHTARTDLLVRLDDKTLAQQKILNGIQRSEIKVPEVLSRETLLAQEKLRMIREETMRSKKVFDEVQLTKLR